MKVIVVEMDDTQRPAVFPSWRSLVAFYRAKPKVAVGTVVMATLPNLLWIVDRVA